MKPDEWLKAGIKKGRKEVLDEIEKWVKKTETKLKKGCGSYQNYWGHKCKSTFTNTQGNVVTVYCDMCQAKMEYITRLKEKISTMRQKP